MARTYLRSVRDVTAALGGPTNVSILTRRSLGAVTNWAARGRLPPQLYRLMSRALARIGYDADPALWSQDAPEHVQ